MSDAAVEPGAPADTTKSIPPAQEKSVAKEVNKRAPPKALSMASTPDQILLRMNKLIATPGGLNAFLSTANYTLYLLTYLEAKTLPLQARLAALVGRTISPATVAAPSHIAALGALLSSCRTTLRLFGLLPLYAWMRSLMQGPKPGQDPVLYATAVTQCSLYMVFQGLENIGLLTDNKVLAPSATARWNPSGGTARIYLWSYRAWLAAVLCDFVRLGREAQLTSSSRANRSSTDVSVTEEDEKKDAQWWSELVVPFSWTPVAVQFAGVREGGIPGFNLGIMGACGAMAGLGRTAALWQGTK